MRENANILPLNVEGITYSAGGRVLIEGISFLLPRGGVTCILGPNGAGKSLLLRLCHGLISRRRARSSGQTATVSSQAASATRWCSRSR